MDYKLNFISEIKYFEILSITYCSFMFLFFLLCIQHVTELFIMQFRFWSSTLLRSVFLGTRLFRAHFYAYQISYLCWSAGVWFLLLILSLYSPAESTINQLVIFFLIAFPVPPLFIWALGLFNFIWFPVGGAAPSGKI